MRSTLRLRLAVFWRQPRLFRLQHLYSLGERRVGGHAAEVAEHFLGLDRETLEQKNFSGKAQRHARDFPRAFANLALLHQKMSALIEMPQNSPSESDIFEQGPVDSCDPVRH